MKTPLFFRQVIGRFVRTIRGMQANPSFLFLPADSTLARLAAEIEAEMRHQLVATGDSDDRGESGGAELQPGGFLPLDARLQPWTTVMSGLPYRDPDQAAAIEVLSRQLQLPAEEVRARLGVDDQPVLPELPDETDFERRGRLRRERKRLVGILHHETGREYRELQQEINEVVATGRPIDDHTIAELEAAVRLLTREIAGHGGASSEEAA